MVTCANLKSSPTWSMSYKLNENSWEYVIEEISICNRMGPRAIKD